MPTKNSSKSTNTASKVVGSLDVEEMSKEFRADFTDKRLTKRAVSLGKSLAARPSESLPNLLDPAGLEGAYRLINHDNVHWRALHAPHQVETLKRCAQSDGPVLVLHDTTELSLARYSSERLRRGMVSPSSRTQGMFLHASFAVSGGSIPVPLGTLGMQPFVHRKDLATAGPETEALWQAEKGLYDNEMQRWFDGIIASQAHLSDLGCEAVHIADCECDAFGLLVALARRGVSLIFRSDGTRTLTRGAMKDFGTATISFGERGDLRNERKVKAHPVRSARTAKVRTQAGAVTFRGAASRSNASWSPDPWEEQPREATLNLVEVEELEPPAGEAPMHWLLLTTLPVDTKEQVARVVDGYRRRWLVEELFKALKTGCSLEERQMDSASAMLNVMALLLPVAWRLLTIRTLGEQQPDASWKAVLTPIEFDVLQHRNNSRSRSPRYQLARNATVAQVLAAVARLGGHIASNGRPGWRTLYAGWEQLSQLVEGAELMQAIQRRRR